MQIGYDDLFTFKAQYESLSEAEAAYHASVKEVQRLADLLEAMRLAVDSDPSSPRLAARLQRTELEYAAAESQRDEDGTELQYWQFADKLNGYEAD